MVRISPKRKSSYRLGRRLKASRKDRLDYITYLMTGADNGKGGGPIPPGQMAASIEGEGLLNAALLVSTGLQGVIIGGGNLGAVGFADSIELAGILEFGGELTAKLGISRIVSGDIELGGELSSVVTIVQRVAATIDAGGEVYAHMFPPHRLVGTIDTGGEINGNVIVTKVIEGTISGEGRVSANVLPAPAIIIGSIDGGGELIADVKEPPVIVTLSATIGGEGNFMANVNVLVSPAQRVINAMTVTPDASRQQKIKDFVNTLLVAGIWDKLDAFYMLYAHDEQAARINWINPEGPIATVVGAPVFVADSHYAGVNGINTGALNTGLYLERTGFTTKWRSRNASMFAYSDQNSVNANEFYGAVGAFSTATVGSRIAINNSTSTAQGRIYFTHANANVAETVAVDVPTNDKLMAATVDSSFTERLYRNNQLKVTQTLSVPVSQNITNPVAVLGATNANGTIACNARPYKAAGWGQYLTQTELANIQSQIETFMAGDISVLIVGGGGGGGAGGLTGSVAVATGNGGGGGGGVTQLFGTSAIKLEPGTYPVVVGNGGLSNTNGTGSSFNGTEVLGGGAGGGASVPGNGSSGGGGRGGNTTTTRQTGGTGTSPLGRNGGNGGTAISGDNGAAGGGGGGAVGAGTDGGSANPSGNGGGGGTGRGSSLSGTNLNYGGGGGGGGSGTAGTGGVPGGRGGAGGNVGANGGDAAANSGGGGGGAGANGTAGGKGADGIVIIRYPGAPRGTGGTITTVGTDTVHTFTSSGDLVIT